MTGGSIAAPSTRERRGRFERRVERSRRTLELLLDSVFRPGWWAAIASNRLGLQGRVRTSTTEIATARAGSATHEFVQPLRIGFASDFHAGPTTHPRMLREACDALTALRPDVVLLGGDFVSVRAADIARLAPELAKIPAPLGKFGVLGNHDLRANRREVIAALETAGVRMITNQNVTLPAPYAHVTVCGLDDATRGTPRADLAFEGVEAGSSCEQTRIVLMHSPEGLTAIGDRPFDIAFCGHTHGGQVALPWGKPLLVPGGRLNRRYCNGQFELDGERQLLVSRGVGCSTLPVRLFAAPEVHLCLIV